ncbi:metallophosphoesterase [Jiangella anatolica]|uniref:metallophosphoesterase n=1 Tax=Jiangella anatolica TaxID=2670374 RepID=UPI000DA814C9|nr:metallophosphoesterase [Jiangella anatolica]
MNRPHDLSPAETGFVPQRPVPWLNPGLLAGTAVRVLLAYLFGGYLDKRELQAALPDRAFDHSAADELWFDYTADVGDGFDATYSVASLLARPSLVAGGHTLPRGDLLLLGGDQVYPTASNPAYEHRWKGPYRAALPDLAVDTPSLYALPGNHDWYDGLTAFLRLFAQGDTIGGWRTRQARSYFALELPHDWWLFAVDIQLSSYIDEPQLDYFRRVAEHLGPEQRIILMPAQPSWVKTHERPDAYDSVDYFIRTIIEPTGAQVPLLLAGDMHHYARYTGPDRQLITCGGGGAYLVGTDHLPDVVAVPPEETITRRASQPQRYQLAAAYPSQPASRRLGWQVFGRLPRRNPGFVGLLAVMQTLLMLAFVTSPEHLVTPATVTGVAAVLVGTAVFTLVLGVRTRKHMVAAVAHAVPHVALGIGGAAAWSALPLDDVANPWATLLAFVVYGPVIGLADTWVVSAYLLVARYFDVNVNELYAGMGIEDHKSFLRFHLGADGSLTVYPVAVERVAHRWRADPDGAPGTPWIVPEEPLEATLAEPPVVVAGPRTAAG